MEQQYSHRSLCHSFHRSLQVGSELKPWSHLDLPRKMYCARGKKRITTESIFIGKSHTSPWSLHTYWKGVNQIPAELLCHETGDATALHQLRKLGWVAKCIWEPKLKKTKKKWSRYEKDEETGLNTMQMKNASYNILHTVRSCIYCILISCPYLFAVESKLLIKEALAFQELPHHRFTWRQVTILTKHSLSFWSSKLKSWLK